LKTHPSWRLTSAIRTFHPERRKGLLTLLAVFVFCASCATQPVTNLPETGSSALAASPNLVVGRIVAVDPERGFAFVDLGFEAPAGAQVDGAELIVRTLDLRETARLRASSYVHGKTLGTKIVSGQPSPGDEVVWHMP
jgi:hypothetical protein